jgi:proline iminopeptidase
MKRSWILTGWLFLFIQYACQTSEISLWPWIEPFQTGYLKVSDIHEIYYELCGNPEGKPVFVLHGGPGGSCSPTMRRFFNPDKFLIVLHDQRGCGKSKPFAEVRENTTQNLVEDIEQLRKMLHLGQIVLFGGSWGSTLSLAYGETYPQHVSGMVLRGIFTARQSEIDHFYHGGVRSFFPEVYDRFISALDCDEGQNIPSLLSKLIQDSDQETQQKYSRLWAAYEIKLSGLEVSDENLKSILNSFDPLAFGLLENYYMANRCFLKENELFDHTDRIANTPIILVNGRYDVICPPITAYQLHKRLPQSKLVIAESSGHWMGEKPIERALLTAMREFE